MERDLRRIQKQIISKERAKACTARKIECCIIDKKTVWLKEHKTKEKYLIEKKAYITYLSCCTIVPDLTTLCVRGITRYFFDTITF